MASNYADEFPLLAAQNLYAADIKGDGNCLFNALSDQLYGHQGEHERIRATVIQHMRENAAHYKAFMDVNPGGGQRRNPKRKNAGTYSSQSSGSGPTQSEIDRVFDAHLKNMAQGGTYGDNMEIVAFAKAFKVDVKVYQHDFAYVLPAPEDGTEHQMAHIAYHTWEHYSSIRNIDGPHTGRPNICPKPLSPEEDAKNKEEAAKISRVLPWMIDVVHSTLPYAADKDIIRKVLEQSKGNIDIAVNVLLDGEERASSSSQTGSSSTERDADSDDEDLDAPNKKQDRRMSRATRAMKKERAPKMPTVNISSITSEADTTSDSAGDVKPSVSPRRRLVPKSKLSMKKEQDNGWIFVTSDNNEDADRSSIEIIDDSDLSGISRAASLVPESQDGLSLRPKNNIKLVVKPKSDDSVSQPVRVPARQKADLKKAAQKAARKESKKSAAQTTRTLENIDIQSATSTSNPPIEIGRGIKTLYI